MAAHRCLHPALPGALDRAEHHHVRASEAVLVVGEERARPRVRVRRVDGDEASRGIPIPGGRDRHLDLGGVVSVVVDHRDTAHLTDHLEAACRPAERGACLDASLQRCAGVDGEHEGCHGVERAVPAREGERHLVLTAGLAHRECLHRTSVAAEADAPGSSLLASIGDHPARRVGLERRAFGIVGAEHQEAGGGHRPRQLAEGGAVGVKRRVHVGVVELEAGHAGRRRADVEELGTRVPGGCGVLVALEHERPGPESGAAAEVQRRRSQPIAGVHPAGVEHVGEQ